MFDNEILVTTNEECLYSMQSEKSTTLRNKVISRAVLLGKCLYEHRCSEECDRHFEKNNSQHHAGRVKLRSSRLKKQNEVFAIPVSTER